MSWVPVDRIYPHGILTVYDDFSQKTPWRNTELRVIQSSGATKTFYANGCILAENSGYFALQLRENQDSVVVLNNESPARILLLLQAVHPSPWLRSVDLENCCALALISLDYGFRHLHGLCQNVIEAHIDDMDRSHVVWLFERLLVEMLQSAHSGPRTWTFQFLYEHIVNTFSIPDLRELSISSALVNEMHWKIAQRLTLPSTNNGLPQLTVAVPKYSSSNLMAVVSDGSNNVISPPLLLDPLMPRLSPAIPSYHEFTRGQREKRKVKEGRKRNSTEEKEYR